VSAAGDVRCPQKRKEIGVRPDTKSVKDRGSEMGIEPQKRNLTMFIEYVFVTRKALFIDIDMK